MDYKVMRDRIEDMVNDNHRDFVKAIISIEKGINDERDLDKLYDTYEYSGLFYTIVPARGYR